MATVSAHPYRAEELSTKSEVIYPENDGNPIAENTLQFEYITVIHGGLDARFAEDPDVFVAADNLWYPVQGHPEICTAPDVYVVFGRPKGHRGSYQQWREGNIAPQVVFEILSPGNRVGEVVAKWVFYNRYGVEEYYLYDPQRNDLSVWIRNTESGQLEEVEAVSGFVSPRLQVRFEQDEERLRLFHPNGEPFQTFRELMAERDALANRAAKLAERLREMGINPDEI
ncbi:MAG: Uma2 family endonuclease [Armatimonadaceae bacterium]